MKFSRFITISTLVAACIGGRTDALGAPNPLLICRAHQCAASTYSFSKGFLLNALEQMMSDNVGHAIRVCDADPNTHACMRQGMRIPAKAAFASANITIPEIRLVDVKLAPTADTLNLVWDYRVKANKTYPVCSASSTRLTVPFVNKVQIRSTDFGCDMTETGRTLLNASYDVDYIDFDYGLMGAYYTLGTAGAVQGSRSGYVLMSFGAKSTVQMPEEAFVVPPPAAPKQISAAPLTPARQTAPDTASAAAQPTEAAESLYQRPNSSDEESTTAPQEQATQPEPVLVDDYEEAARAAEQAKQEPVKPSKGFMRQVEDILYF